MRLKFISILPNVKILLPSLLPPGVKLRLLDLDPVMVHLAPFYSTTGCPALSQPQIIRSLILMLHLGVTSLTRWMNRFASDE